MKSGIEPGRVFGRSRALVVALTALLPAALTAQSPSWTASLFVRPDPSPFLADWNRDPRSATLTLLYSGTAAQDYQIDATVRSSRGELAHIRSPMLSMPFGPTTQIITAADIIDWQTISADAATIDQVQRSGTIPEGQYQLCVRGTGAAGGVLFDACESFAIELPEPPQLVFPANAGVAIGPQPVFQWTPVLAPPEMGLSYKVRVVERYAQQTPATALASNPVWYEGTAQGAPMLVYPVDALPMRAGQEYAWQVEVVDAEGRRLSRRGRSSEIWTFVARDPGGESSTIAAGIPDTIELVPGVARVIGLRSAKVEETELSYSASGAVTLQLTGAVTGEIPVTATALRIAKAALPGIQVLGGALEGAVKAGALVGGKDSLVAITRIGYTPQAGITANASMRVGSGAEIALDGTLYVTSVGLSGILRAEGKNGVALALVGDDPVRVALDQVQLSLPTGALAMTSHLELFGTRVPCDGFATQSTTPGKIVLAGGCTPHAPIPFGDGGSAHLAIESVSGTVELGLPSLTVGQHQLGITGAIDLGLGTDGSCGATFVVSLKDGDLDASAQTFMPRCDVGSEKNFGWMRAKLASLTVDRFGYATGKGFDFLLHVKLTPWVAEVPGLALPELPTVAITERGLEVPETDTPVSAPPFELLGYTFKVTRAKLPGFVLTWRDWRLGIPTGFRFALDAEVGTSGLPSATASCLSAQPLATTLELGGGKMGLEFPDRTFTPACALDIAATIPKPGLIVEMPAPIDIFAALDPNRPDKAPKVPLTPREEEIQKLPLELQDSERYKDSLTTIVDSILRQERTKMLLSIEDTASTPAMQKVVAILDDSSVYKRIVRPRLQYAAQHCSDGSLDFRWAQYGMSTLIGMERERELLGAGEGSSIFGDTLVQAVERRCAVEAAAVCVANPTGPTAAKAVGALFGIMRDRELLGMNTDSSGTSMWHAMNGTPRDSVEIAFANCWKATQAAQAKQSAVLDPPPGQAPVDFERGRRVALAGSVPFDRHAGAGGPFAGPEVERWFVRDASLAERDDAWPSRMEPANGRPAAFAGARAAFAPDSSSDSLSLSLRVEITRLTGRLVIHLPDELSGDFDGTRILEIPEIEGSLVLPTYFTCSDSSKRVVHLGSNRLKLGPRGQLSGEVTNIVPDCEVDLAAVKVALTASTLRFDTDKRARVLTLEGGATASFTAAGQPVQGTGSLTIDLLRARMIDGSIAFNGPFRYDVPKAQPVLSFELAKAVLDTAGLHIDGRNSLALGESATIGTTFDAVTVNPLTARLTSGSIAFDLPFALEIGVTDTVASAIAWHAVPAGAPLSLQTGLRVDLPTGVSVTPQGVAATGQGAARLVYGGRDLDSLSSRFSTDFAVGWDPIGVSTGRVDFASDGSDIGYLDATGFHPAMTFLATALLPERLPLPTETVAYLELRDPQGNLRVNVQKVAQGTRIFTPQGVSLPLVVPALTLDRGAAPAAQATVDLTLSDADLHPIAGEVHAGVPVAQRATWDLATSGIPVALDTLSYESRNGQPFALYLAGGLNVFGARQKPGSTIELALDGNGHLQGQVSVAANGFDPVPLVASSNKLALAIQAVSGNIDADLTTGRLDFDLDLDGGLQFELADGKSWTATAKLHADEKQTVVSQLTTQAADSTTAVEVGGARLRLSNLRLPTLRYVYATQTFDFEALFDAQLELAQFPGMVFPPLEDVALTESGFSIPAYSIPDLTQATVTTYNGFVIRPLALRSKGITYDWFHGKTVGDWGLRFDLEVSLDSTKVGPTTPAWVKQLKLSVLDAGISNGYVVGRIVQREIQQAYATGKQIAITVDSIYGCLTDPTKQASPGCQSVDTATDSVPTRVGKKPEPKVDVYVGGKLAVKLSDACSNAGQPYEIGINLKFKAVGGIDGNIDNVVPPCVFDLGFARLTPGPSKLVVATYEDTVTNQDGSKETVFADSVNVFLRSTATVKFPAPNGTDSVAFNGLVSLELFNDPRIVDGFIGLGQPIRLRLPTTGTPLATFVVTNGRLDRSGLVVSGTGSLETSDGASIAAQFNNLTLGFGNGGVVDGSVQFLNQFALTGTIGQGGVSWAAVSSQAPRPNGSALRVTVPDTAVIDKNGLTLGGSATAELQFQDSVYASLGASFVNGFRLGFAPAAVTQGRANFTLNDELIAHVDANGFWPGNVFGVLPLPQRLALPTEDVAYIELKDPQGQPLVETATDPDGLRLSTKNGQTVALVVPALQGNASTPPTVNVAFSVVVNPNTYQIASGYVRATAPDSSTSLFDLGSLGIPAHVRRLGYESVNGSYGLTLDARITLPGPADSVPVYLKNVAVTAQGLSGTVEVGALPTAPDPGLPAIGSATVLASNADTVTLEVTGVRAQLVPTGQGTSSVTLAGRVRSTLFSDQTGESAALFFSGTVSPSGLVASIDPQELPNGELPLSIATFQPQPMAQEPAVTLTATAQEFTVRLNGLLRIPKLGPNFMVSIRGVELGSKGIVIPDISTAGGAQVQVAELFGMQLTLKDSVNGNATVYPAVRFTRPGRVFTLETTGEIAFLGNTARFYGLRVASDGKVGIAYAKLLDKPVQVVQNALSVDDVTIASDTLRATASVTLPAPLDQAGAQQVNLRIAPDGSITGGGRIVAVNQPEKLDGEDPYTYQVGPVLTAHLRYLALDLDFQALKQNSSVQVVADVYLQNSPDNRIELGQVNGNAIAPGLTVHFDRAPEWGNIALADTFTFDFDVLKVSLNSVTASKEPTGGLAVMFNGGFGLDLSTVSGAVNYEKFRVTSAGVVDLDSASVVGGELSIANTVALQLTGFEYSATPTTITVSDGGEPADQAQQSERSATIAVSSFLRFGGAIDVAGVFAGGVDTVMIYRRAEDQKVSMIVRNAHMSIQNVVTAQADMVFRQMQGSDFEFTVGARGSLVGAADVALVGTIGTDQGLVRAGLFVAVKTNAPGAGLVLVPPPGPPVITITGLGGGIFLNPKASHIDLVRKYAGVKGSAGDSIKPPADANFAVMLYGAAAITPAKVVEGQVLVTVTNTELMLDGLMTVLAQQDKLEGEGHLKLRWGSDSKSASAQGILGLNVKYGAVLQTVDGNGAQAPALLGFKVYDQNNWSVDGHAAVKVIALLDAEADLAVGPFGFFAKTTITPPAPFSIVHFVDLGGGAWYHLPTQQWGMQVQGGIEASLVVASAGGTLYGALIGQGLSVPYLYGVAEAYATWPGGEWRGSVWAKLSQQGLSAGFGRDSVMEQMIADARALMTDVESQADAAATAVAQAALTAGQVAYTPAELAAAYQRVGTFNRFGQLVLGMYEADEFGSTAINDPSSYPSLYMRALLQQGAKRDTTDIVSLASSVENLTNTIAQRRQAVAATLSSVTATLGEPADVPSITVPNAIAQADLEPAEIDSTLVGGYWVRSVKPGTGPQVSIDASAASQATSVLAQQEAAVVQTDQQVRAALQALEDAYATTRAATSVNSSGSLLEYAGLHANALSSAEQQIAMQANYLQRRRDWAAAYRDSLAALNNTAQSLIADKTATIRASGASLYPLADARSRLLLTMLGQPVNLVYVQGQSYEKTLKDAYDAYVGSLSKSLDVNTRKALAQDWLAARANNDGVQAWYLIGREGTKALADSLNKALTALTTDAPGRLAKIRDFYAEISDALAALYDHQTALAGTLYDLYDRYLYTRRGTDSTGDTTQFAARRTALATALQVPKVGPIMVTERRDGYMSRYDFSWSASHPDGVYDFEIRDAESSVVGSAPIYAVGATQSFTTARYTTLSGTQSQQRTLEVRARGGAGFAGFGRANYQVTITPGSPAPGSVASVPPTVVGQSTADGTPPSAPVITFPDRYPVNGAIWVRPTSSLHVAWNATDAESGVGEYEYGLALTAPVYTAPSGGTGIVGVVKNGNGLTLAGSTTTSSAPPAGYVFQRPWTSSGGRDDVSIEGITFPSDTALFITARARNGSGLLGTATVSTPIRVDATAPTWPSSGAPLAPIAATSAQSSVPVATYAACAPSSGGLALAQGPLQVWGGGLVNAGPQGETPTRTFTYPVATDSQSLVRDYFYRIDTVPATAYDGGDDWQPQGRSSTTTVSGAPLDYTHSFYASVVAVNNAGLASALYVIGPFTVPDPTAPTAPTLCAFAAPSGSTTSSGTWQLGVTVQQAATDLETGVVGYEYRVRRGYPLKTMVRNWPSTVDWTTSNGRGTFNTTSLTLVDGAEYWVDVRAVNAQGGRGEVATSGPIVVDASPPPTPTVSATSMSISGNRAVAVTIGAPDDPQTHLAAIEVAIGSADSLTDVSGWTVVPGTGPSLSTTLGLPSSVTTGSTYWVHVRTRNGAGNPSTVAHASFVARAALVLQACLPNKPCLP